MQLIKKIEINYLRSLYTCIIKDAGDLNIVFGRNDSGKSNLLRALNLFFNDETDVHTELDFDIDLADARRKLARDAKGRQFIWIKITFSVPENYVNALGKEISVKRQWNRDGALTQTESPRLKTSGQVARLSRLLNDIDFTYIPAIKDLAVYADLVERMYASAAESSEMVAATQDFVRRVGDQSTALTSQLEALFGSKTTLSAPTDMSSLFRSLDFAHGEDGHSLFKQKGDGIKARHIPEILSFINVNDPRKKFYIWGIEEPENSLDLSAAGQEAQRFAKIASSDTTQVFVTSHSPAFYLSDDDKCKIRRTFIRRQSLVNGEVVPEDAARAIDFIDDADEAMAAAGLMELPHVIRNLSGWREKAETAKQDAVALLEELNSTKIPRLFVEGKHDLDLFKKLCEDKFGKDSLMVSALHGTPSTTSAFLSKLLDEGGISSSTPTLFLYDNDPAGRRAFKNLTGQTFSSSNQMVRFSNNTYATCLPNTDENFRKFLNDSKIPESESIFVAEFLFNTDSAAKLLDDLLEYDAEERTKIHEEYFKKTQDTVLRLQSYKAGTPDWLFARTVPNRLKQNFNKSVQQLDCTHPSLDAVLQLIGSELAS